MRHPVQVFLLASTLLVMCAAPVHAQSQARNGTVSLRNVAEMEATSPGADGKPQVRRMPVDKVLPGDQVIYTSTFRNTGSKPAGNISITNPIPANTTLVGGSAFGANTDITFSADGGKTWAAADKVRVRGTDGVERAAGLSEFTHVRWVYRGELPPGRESSAGFRVTVN